MSNSQDSNLNLANSFYTVCYSIPNPKSLENFDPFEIDWKQADVEPEVLAQCIDVVIKNAEFYTNTCPEVLEREGGLLDYLADLKTKITSN